MTLEDINSVINTEDELMLLKFNVSVHAHLNNIYTGNNVHNLQ